MICPKCNVYLPEGTATCPQCGAQLTEQPVQQAPQSAPQDPWAAPAKRPVNAMGMGWFKFLIYFALFAGALMNAYTGIQLLTGSHYGGEAELVYTVFKGLKFVDMLVGVLTIGLAVLGIYTRFRLAGYHNNGPTLLTCLYVCAMITNLIYVIGVQFSVSEYSLDLDFTSFYTNIASSCVMCVINYYYFKKRAHMFLC